MAERTLNQKGGIVSGILSFVFGLIVTVIALRLVLRMLGANPGNAIVDWIYDVSYPFVQPFFGMFNTSTIDLGVGRFEIETLVALIVYGVIAGLVLSLFGRDRFV